MSVLQMRKLRLREVVTYPRSHKEKFSIWPEFVPGANNKRGLSSHTSEGGSWPGPCGEPTRRRV